MVPEALTSRDRMTPPKMPPAGLRVSAGRAPTEGVASHARGRPHLWAGPAPAGGSSARGPRPGVERRRCLPSGDPRAFVNRR